MRVVAGKYRAKKLKEFDLSSTRPTLDRVKEAIFSSIQFDCLKAVVLDLFSGTGALGIEAISRGADKVYFVDKEKRAIEIIKENLKGITEDYELHYSNYISFLEKHKDIKFNIVLLDPPYATDFGEKAIDFILTNSMLAEKGVIVLEKDYTKPFNKEYSGCKITEKKYGSVGVIFLRKN